MRYITKSSEKVHSCALDGICSVPNETEVSMRAKEMVMSDATSKRIHSQVV